MTPLERSDGAAGFTIGWHHQERVLGASHRRSGTACQDAVEVAQGDVSGQPYLILAVADGHGDPKHDLSEHGSRFAVDAAIDELQSLFEIEAARAAGTRVGLSQAFSSRFPRAVVHRWRKLVEQDENASDGAASYTRYGTTLIVALITSTEAYVGRIGDGDLVFVDRLGVQVEDAFSPRTARIGTTTDSLCMQDATRLWQTRVVSLERIGLLMLSTDGLGDSFEDQPGLWKFASDLDQHLRASGGRDLIKARLPVWLEEMTESGSGDDISVALFANDH